MGFPPRFPTDRTKVLVKGKDRPPLVSSVLLNQSEIAKALFDSATEEQKEVLKLMGVEQPSQPPPDLAELCRQHMSALPESIRQLLEKQAAEPDNTPTVSEISKRFKIATADLRDPVIKKSALQLKLNKTKASYAALLTEMQQMEETLSSQQQAVSALQQELQDRVQSKSVLPANPDLLKLLQELGVQLSEEQKQKINVIFGTEAPLKEPPVLNMEIDGPPGLLRREVGKPKERKDRSRSPKGNANGKDL